MLALLAATGGYGGGTTPAPTTPRLALSASVNIVFDGNSITNDHLATGLDDLVKTRLDLDGKRNGATFTTAGGLGVSGQTWANMRLVQDDLHAAWRDGMTNVLVVGESTNSAWNGRDAQGIIADARAYLASARAVHPWIILLWGTIPRGHADAVTYPADAGHNADLLTVDAYLAQSYTDMGAHGFVNVRAGIPMFDHDGSDPAKFTAYQTVWNEAPPSTAGWDAVDLGWVHPKDGTWTSGETPATGKRAIAEQIAAALTSGQLPATA